MVATSPQSAATNPRPKLGDILRDALPELRRAWWLSDHQAKVLRRLSRCGTNELGVVLLKCDTCGGHDWRPLSCQDRHCPSCGAKRAEQWVQDRLAEQLDVPCFHLVFPVPGELYPLFHENPRELYALLFSAVQLTLKQLAADADDLGGTPAFVCVLHTTNRQLGYCPHIHVLMSGATFDLNTGDLAVVPDHEVLFPQGVLDEAYRERFLTQLRDLADAGKLDLARDSTRHFADDTVLDDLIDKLHTQAWKTWLAPAAGGAEATIRYLARNTHRTPITNARIKRYDGDSVTYAWQDIRTRQYRARTRTRADFIRTFSQHILPKGFQRIRFYGLFAPARRQLVLPRARAAATLWAKRHGFTNAIRCALQPERIPPMRCEACGQGILRPVAIFRRFAAPVFLGPGDYPRPPPTPQLPTRRGDM